MKRRRAFLEREVRGRYKQSERDWRGGGGRHPQMIESLRDMTRQTETRLEARSKLTDTTTGWSGGRMDVYDAIYRRRDVREFRPDPVPDAVLARVLHAAHRAGSVGLMQPWNFVVIRCSQLRAQVAEVFEKGNSSATCEGVVRLGGVRRKM